MTPIEATKAALTGAGVTVYDPAERVGICKSACAVVYDGGTEMLSRGQGVRVVGVMCMAPLTRTAELVLLTRTVEDAMRTTALRLRGTVGGQAVDDQFKAVSVTLEFAALCAI